MRISDIRSVAWSGAPETPIETVIRSVVPGAREMIVASIRWWIRSAMAPGLAVDARQEHGKLLAAVTGRDVAVAHARAEDTGERSQRFVTGRVTIAIVERLEVVDVEHQHRQRLVPGAVLERLLDRLIEGAAVGEAGSRIGVGLAVEGRQEPPVADGEGGMFGNAGDARLHPCGSAFGRAQ